MIYFNLLSAGKAWVEQEAVPAVVGMWWVHVVMLGVAGVMLGYQNGLHRRFMPFKAI
jgi:lipopolysaccharide export system permease protein